MPIGLTLVSLLASTFVVGDVKIFEDWAVGCDNARFCHATSLPIDEVSPYPIGDGSVSVSITRDGALWEPPVLTIGIIDDQPAKNFLNIRGIAIDGRKLDIPIYSKIGLYVFNDTLSSQLIAAAQHHQTLSLTDNRGGILATASLKGLVRALQYIDAKQYLKGTTIALAQPGTAKAGPRTIPLMHPRRSINVAALSNVAPKHITDAKLQELHALDPCLPYRSDETIDPVKYHRLDAEYTLLVVPTSCGGYNPVSLLFIVDEQANAERASFWIYPGATNVQDVDLPDIWWDATARLLSSFGRGRVLADCGQSQSYAWYNRKFMLVRDLSMPVCRGSNDYITTYQIEVVIDQPTAQ